jgi:flagellar biogenesis protein FliO
VTPRRACAWLALALCAPLPAIAQIPYKDDAGDLGALLVRSLLAMAAIVVATFAILYVMRRFGLAPVARPANATLRLVETLRVGPRASLVVVQWGLERILVGQNEHGMTVIAREPAAPEQK